MRWAGCLIRHTDQPLLFSPPLSIIKHPSTLLQTFPPLFCAFFFFFTLTEEVNGETGSQALTETGRIGGERSCCTQVRSKPTLLPAPSREFPSCFCLTHPPPFASSAVASPSQNICRLSHLPVIRRSSPSFCLPHVCSSPLSLHLTSSLSHRFFFFLPQCNTGYVGFFFFPPGGVRNGVEGRHTGRVCLSQKNVCVCARVERGAAWCFSVREAVSAVGS